MSDKKIKHVEHVASLAAHFKRLEYGLAVFSEVQLNPTRDDGAEFGIADVMVMNLSYKRQNLRIYEVKASMSDLSQDIDKGKWRKYLSYCDRFYFAIGDPDIEWRKKIFPDMPCGVIVRKWDGWKVARKPPLNKHEPMGATFWLSIIFSQVLRMQPQGSAALEAQKVELLTADIKKLTPQFNAKLADERFKLKDRENDLEYKEGELERDRTAVDAQTEGRVLDQLRERLGMRGNWRDNLDEFIGDLTTGAFKKAVDDALEKEMEIFNGRLATLFASKP